MKQVMNEEAIAVGFRCANCHQVATFYDEETDRVLCDKCKEEEQCKSPSTP